MGPWRRLDAVPALTAGHAAASVLSIVQGIQRTPSYAHYGYYSPSAAGASLAITGEACGVLLPRLAAAGMLVRLDPDTGESVPLAWDDGPPWRTALGVHEAGRAYELRLLLRREPGDPAAPTETLDLSSVVTYSADAIVLPDRVARFSCPSTKWMEAFVEGGIVPLQARDVERFVRSYYAVPRGAELGCRRRTLSRASNFRHGRARTWTHRGRAKTSPSRWLSSTTTSSSRARTRRSSSSTFRSDDASPGTARPRRQPREGWSSSAYGGRGLERDRPRWDRDAAPKPALTLKPALAPKVIRRSSPRAGTWRPRGSSIVPPRASACESPPASTGST